MEISSSTIAGALRVGIQVVSTQKRPALEIYHQVHNRYGPEIELQVPKGSDPLETYSQKTRFQDIFIQFTLINIGGQRAENIELAISGKLKRNSPREDFGDNCKAVIPQMAPGQIQYLFRFDSSDLNIYPDGGGPALGLKDESLTISVKYDAPKGIVNWLLSLPSRLRKEKRFITNYTFSPKMVAGDLPPAEYA